MDEPICPECGVGTIEVVTDGLVGEFYAPGFQLREDEVPIRMVMAPFGACNACEFCVRIDTRIMNRAA